MALFFVSFRRNPVCDLLKLPRFPISNNERKRNKKQAQLNEEKKAAYPAGGGQDTGSAVEYSSRGRPLYVVVSDAHPFVWLCFAARDVPTPNIAYVHNVMFTNELN